MATISEILAIENQSESQINLFREGIFWKAYQESAYLILQQSGKFKVSKKYVKSVNREIVSIGFPESTLTRIFASDQLTKTTEKQLSIACSPIDVSAYEAWFDSVKITEKVKQTEKTETVAPPIPQEQEEQAEATNKQDRIIRRLQAFRIEHSTPMDCMAFLVSIRNDLDPR